MSERRPSQPSFAQGSGPTRVRTGEVSVRRRNTGEGLDDDRRDAPRARYATFVRLAAAGRQIDGRSETISATGLSVVARESIPVGTRATARFALPVSDKLVSLPCTVVRVGDDHGSGVVLAVTFEVSSSEVQLEIGRFIAAFGEAGGSAR